MLKQDLERELGARVEGLGGRMFKFSLMGISGFPTQMVILPGGHIGFIITGARDKSNSDKCTKQIQTLRTLGCAAARVDEASQIDRLLCYIMSDAGKDPKWHIYQNSLSGKMSDDI